MRQAIVFTGQRALGVDVDDGRLLWSYDRVANRTANIATPIVRGNRVFLSSDYGTGAALLELAPTATAASRRREVYFTNEMRNHHASSVLVGDYLYGFSRRILTAMQFDTGKVAWRDRSVGKGSVVFADDRLYLFSENGVVGLAEANPAGIPRARPLPAQDRAACRPGAIRSSRAASSSCAIRTRFTRTTSRGK